MKLIIIIKNERYSYQFKIILYYITSMKHLYVPINFSLIAEKEMDRNIVILLYIIFVGFLSIALFLYGFFPLMYYDNTIATQDNIPEFIENTR